MKFILFIISVISLLHLNEPKLMKFVTYTAANQPHVWQSFPMPEENYIEFNVKANGHVYVGLDNTHNMGLPYYYIVQIHALETKPISRVYKVFTNKLWFEVLGSVEGARASATGASFWVAYESGVNATTGKPRVTIKTGVVGQAKPFMEVTDHEYAFYDVTHFGFNTYTTVGTWEIDAKFLCDSCQHGNCSGNDSQIVQVKK